MENLNLSSADARVRLPAKLAREYEELGPWLRRNEQAGRVRVVGYAEAKAKGLFDAGTNQASLRKAEITSEDLQHMSKDAQKVVQTLITKGAVEVVAQYSPMPSMPSNPPTEPVAPPAMGVDMGNEMTAKIQAMVLNDVVPDSTVARNLLDFVTKEGREKQKAQRELTKVITESQKDLVIGEVNRQQLLQLLALNKTIQSDPGLANFVQETLEKTPGYAAMKPEDKLMRTALAIASATAMSGNIQRWEEAISEAQRQLATIRIATSWGLNLGSQTMIGEMGVALQGLLVQNQQMAQYRDVYRKSMSLAAEVGAIESTGKAVSKLQGYATTAGTIVAAPPVIVGTGIGSAGETLKAFFSQFPISGLGMIGGVLLYANLYGFNFSEAGAAISTLAGLALAVIAGGIVVPALQGIAKGIIPRFEEMAEFTKEHTLPIMGAVAGAYVFLATNPLHVEGSLEAILNAGLRMALYMGVGAIIVPVVVMLIEKVVSKFRPRKDSN